MSPPLRRRDLLAGSLACVTLSGCRKTSISGEKPLVSIIRAGSYAVDLTHSIRRMLIEHKVPVRGKRVVLKPNLVEFDAATPITTHPAVVLAALESFRSLGAAEVRIAEGSGDLRDTFEVAEAAGYPAAIPGF